MAVFFVQKMGLFTLSGTKLQKIAKKSVKKFGG
jgi:hypothetical protein